MLIVMSMPVKIPFKNRRRFPYKLKLPVLHSIAHTAFKMRPGKPFSFSFNNGGGNGEKIECLFYSASSKSKDVPFLSKCESTCKVLLYHS